jgi:hypothetical protein
MTNNFECLTARDVYGNDPLIRVLVEKWNMSPLRWALAVFLFGLSYMAIFAWTFGFLLPRKGVVTSSVDVFNQLNFFLIFPGIAFYYLWQPSKIANTYASIFSTINCQGGKVDEAVIAIKKMSVRNAWWLACLALGLLIVGAGIYDSLFKFGRWWYAANWIMIIGLQLARCCVIYMVAIIYARHLTLSAQLNWIYDHFEILSPILPPSQTYGLQAVANYATGFVVFTALIGLNIGLAPFLSTKVEAGYPYQAGLYLVLSTVGFLLPLWGAHAEMAKSKNHILDHLSGQYQNEYNQMLIKLEARDPLIEDDIKRLKSIENAYELAKRCWTWPFDTSVPVKVILTILAPLGLVITQSAQSYLSDLISRLTGS